MGTVHKFKPPPKNRKQFKGYRPEAGLSRKPGFWQRLGPRQRSLLAWALLIAIAAGISGARALLAPDGPARPAATARVSPSS